MANQELEINGNTIFKLLNSGFHSITTLSTGFTGTLQYMVVNGICVVNIAGVTRTSGTGWTTVSNQLPKAAFGTHSNCPIGVFRMSGTSLDFTGTNSQAAYHGIVYAVASDYVEPSV